MNRIPNPFKARGFSSAGFFLRAVLILAAFLLAELAGFRDYTSFISGTTSGNYKDIFGMTYFVLYSFAVFVAPILVIASILMKFLSKFAGAED